MGLFKSLSRFRGNVALINESQKIRYDDLNKFYKKKKDFFSPKTLTLLICDNSLESAMIYVLFMKLKGVVLMLVDENTDINLIKKFLKLYMHEHVALPKKLLTKFNFLTMDEFRLGHYFIFKYFKFRRF